jgi:hypothetical protein
MTCSAIETMAAFHAAIHLSRPLPKMRRRNKIHRLGMLATADSAPCGHLGERGSHMISFRRPSLTGWIWGLLGASVLLVGACKNDVGSLGGNVGSVGGSGGNSAAAGGTSMSTDPIVISMGGAAGTIGGGGSAGSNGCTGDSSCPGGLCIALSTGANVCTTTCASTSDCIAGWTCGAMNGQSNNVCQCTPSPEVCDGLDNDCNGIIDDLDVNNDGVCDCIKIGTLGIPGTHGQRDVFSTWLSARASSGAVVALDSQVLTADLIATFNIIVVQDIYQTGNGRAYTTAEAQVLSDWVNQGGGLMTMTGYGSPPRDNANVNILLAPYQLSYGEVQILKKGASANTVPITQFVPHPITAGVTGVGVDNGYEVSGPANPAPQANFTVYATGGGFRVGEAIQVGKGHVDVWGDEWITYNSEWVNHPDYQIPLFWTNTVKWLTVAGTCQVSIPLVIP